jgi:hypothetical protein
MIGPFFRFSALLVALGVGVLIGIFAVRKENAECVAWEPRLTPSRSIVPPPVFPEYPLPPRPTIPAPPFHTTTGPGR